MSDEISVIFALGLSESKLNKVYGEIHGEGEKDKFFSPGLMLHGTKEQLKLSMHTMIDDFFASYDKR